MIYTFKLFQNFDCKTFLIVFSQCGFAACAKVKDLSTSSATEFSEREPKFVKCVTVFQCAGMTSVSRRKTV